MKKIIITACIASIAFGANAQSPLKIKKEFKIASNGGWDYLAIEPNSNRLYVSHGNQVNVLDKTTGDSIGIIPRTMGVHGIAFVPSLKKGYTTNGKSSSATVFSLIDLSIIDSIKTGQKPDAIFYDEFSKKIIISNGKSKDITFIDPKTDKVVATINVGGAPETAVSDDAGKVFVNLEDKNEIVAIDAVNYKVIAHWSIAPGEAPTGLVYLKKSKRLFAACGDNKMGVIVNAENGTIVEKLAIGAGCDGAVYDPITQNIYTSNGEDGTISIVHQESADKYSVTNVTTQKGARTIAIDEKTQLLYLPTALQEAKEGGKHAKTVAGSFHVLVLGK